MEYFIILTVKSHENYGETRTGTMTLSVKDSDSEEDIFNQALQVMEVPKRFGNSFSVVFYFARPDLRGI